MVNYPCGITPEWRLLFCTDADIFIQDNFYYLLDEERDMPLMREEVFSSEIFSLFLPLPSLQPT